MKNNLQVMNKKISNAASAILRTGSYESPTISVVEIYSEGVLCGSSVGSEFSVEEWENDEDFSW